MLKFDEADATSHRMLREAHRYDEANQRHFAKANLEDSAEERKLGLVYGMCVGIEGLTSRPELNGKEGIVKGRIRDSGRYMVEVNSTILSLNRNKFSIQADRIVQLSVPEKQCGLWVFHGTGLDGSKLSPVQLRPEKLNFEHLRKEFASQLRCHPVLIKLVFPDGVCINDVPLDQLCIQFQTEGAIVGSQADTTSSVGPASRNAQVDASNKLSGSPMVGAVVELQNLIARPELNGCNGKVISKVGGGRWAVMLETGERVSVKGKHMVLAGVACSTVGPTRDASCDLLARSVSVGVDRSAGRPSDIGPAAQCRHGGPDLCEAKTGPFLSTMLGFIGTCLEKQEQLVSEKQQSKLALAEFDIFFRYWSRPEMASTISRIATRLHSHVPWMQRWIPTLLWPVSFYELASWCACGPSVVVQPCSQQ